MRRSILLLTVFITMTAYIQSSAQCSNDTDCKGNRICQDGTCIDKENQPTESYLPAPTKPEREKTSIEKENQPTENYLPAPTKPEKRKNSYPQFGVKGRIGLLLSNARGSGFEEFEDEYLLSGGTARIDDKIQAGFTFGAGFSARFIKLLSAEIELLFAFKNFKVEQYINDPVEGVIVDGEGKFKFTYMEFPIFAKLWIPTNSKFHPNPYAGILIGFNLSAKLHAEYTFNGVSGSEDFDLKKDKGDTDGEVSPVEFAFVLGCEAMLELGPGGIIADIRWVPGVTSVFSDYTLDPDDPIFSDKISLGSVCITFGYLFIF